MAQNQGDVDEMKIYSKIFKTYSLRLQEIDNYGSNAQLNVWLFVMSGGYPFSNAFVNKDDGTLTSFKQRMSNAQTFLLSNIDYNGQASAAPLMMKIVLKLWQDVNLPKWKQLDALVDRRYPPSESRALEDLRCKLMKKKTKIQWFFRHDGKPRSSLREIEDSIKFYSNGGN